MEQAQHRITKIDSVAITSTCCNVTSFHHQKTLKEICQKVMDFVVVVLIWRSFTYVIRYAHLKFIDITWRKKFEK